MKLKLQTFVIFLCNYKDYLCNYKLFGFVKLATSQCSADQNFSREAKRRASTPNDAYRHAANFRPDKFLFFSPKK